MVALATKIIQSYLYDNDGLRLDVVDGEYIPMGKDSKVEFVEVVETIKLDSGHIHHNHRVLKFHTKITAESYEIRDNKVYLDGKELE